MKRFGATYVAVILFFALCAYLMYFRTPPGPPPEPEPEVVSVYRMDSELVSFSIEETGVEFEWINGEWALVADRDYRLDESRVRMLTGTISPLVAERSIGDVDDLGQFGLTEPWLRLTVVFSDGTTKTVAFGDTAPGTGSHYASVEGSMAVFTVPPHRVACVGWTLKELRSNWVTEFEPGDVETFTVSGGDEPAYVFTRIAGGSWRMDSPIVMPADRPAAEDYLRVFQFMRVDSFIDDPGPLSEYGLDEPAATFVAQMAGESRVEISVGRTGSEEDGYQYFAVVPEDPVVYQVTPSWELFPDREEFLTERLMPYLGWEFDRIELARGRSSWRDTGAEWPSPARTERFVITTPDEGRQRDVIRAFTSLIVGGFAGTDEVPCPLPGSGPHESLGIRFQLKGQEAVAFTLVEMSGRYYCWPPGYDVPLWLDSEWVDNLITKVYGSK